MTFYLSNKFFCVGFFLSLLLSECNNNGKTKGDKKIPKVEIESNDSNTLTQKYNLHKIILPKGFKISVYAEVPNARSLTISPSGIVYVGNRTGNKVYAIVDENKDGKGDKVYTVASGLNTPNGVAFKDGSLYIATISIIYKLDSIELRLANPPRPEVIFDQYPSEGHHGWKFIAFGPDGKLYVPVGSPCNICDDENPVYSTITRLNPDGSGMEIFSKGIRNTVGFAWHPVTNKLWFTDNGRDQMGENVPGDELNYAPEKDMHFGFPYCHQGNIPDPKFGKGKNCNNYIAPVQILGPHVAALGMRFYTGSMFPPEFKNQIFIAEHGSWNRSVPLGYRVMLVNINDNNKASSYKPFAEGWLQPDGKVLGRPVDVLVMPDGALLVSDDYSGVVYRIVASPNPSKGRE